MTLGYSLKTESSTSLKHQQEDENGLLPALYELWPQDKSVYPMLSESDLLSPTFYEREDMDRFVVELKSLALANATNEKVKQEIDLLISVAHKCRYDKRNTILVISPFMELRA